MKIKWSLLNEDKFLLNKVSKQWHRLLKNVDLTEHAYHEFLKENAGLMLSPRHCSHFVLSKIKLADEYELDFVTVEDQFSNGIRYNLIEIESPHFAPFNKKGVPSARLSQAIQQIQNWKIWIKENRNNFKRLFPNTSHRLFRSYSNFSFTIYIGNRENSKEFIEKRNELSEQLQIQIRSFDALGDSLRHRYFEDLAPDYDSEMRNHSDEVRNKLASPFYKAFTHSEWKEFLREMAGDKHIISWNADLILKIRSNNKMHHEFLKKYS